jgi:tRNA (cytidine/uridine-2'-O-)-methyltransferase
VNVQLWDSFAQLKEAPESSGRFFFLTTKSDRAYYDVQFRAGDFLVFGRETKGLPETLLAAHAGHVLTIPMRGTRSLNLATAVGIVLFEAMRQIRHS